MAKITKDEVMKIAKMSHIALDDAEIDLITQQLATVLTYAERVQHITAIGGQSADPLPAAVNIFRDDHLQATDPEPILAQAPEHEAHYFVVPKIIESNN